MSSQERAYGVLPQIISVGAGITVGVFVPTQEGTIATQIRTISGGTLFILPANNGSTYAAATLAAIQATFAYMMGASGTESVVLIPGPSAFYLASTGSAVAHIMRFKSSGITIP